MDKVIIRTVDRSSNICIDFVSGDGHQVSMMLTNFDASVIRESLASAISMGLARQKYTHLIPIKNS